MPAHLHQHCQRAVAGLCHLSQQYSTVNILLNITLSLLVQHQYKHLACVNTPCPVVRQLTLINLCSWPLQWQHVSGQENSTDFIVECQKLISDIWVWTYSGIPVVQLRTFWYWIWKLKPLSFTCLVQDQGQAVWAFSKVRILNYNGKSCYSSFVVWPTEYCHTRFNIAFSWRLFASLSQLNWLAKL